MQISKKLAKRFLDVFDEADDDGNLIKIVGGMAGLLQVNGFMGSLKLADQDGVETVDVKETDFRKYYKALSDYKESKGEVFSI